MKWSASLVVSEMARGVEGVWLPIPPDSAQRMIPYDLLQLAILVGFLAIFILAGEVMVRKRKTGVKSPFRRNGRPPIR